ncbi:hypothetical protein BaRGS_00013364 [Batillaria attramentaria]|uniref:Uncharacterized protein n=1 Tax=Batillaria attramentaria TaxID=370345 RepID=A0ABD0L7X3_9CAEN
MYGKDGPDCGLNEYRGLDEDESCQITLISNDQSREFSRRQTQHRDTARRKSNPALINENLITKREATLGFVRKGAHVSHKKDTSLQFHQTICKQENKRGGKEKVRPTFPAFAFVARERSFLSVPLLENSQPCRGNLMKRLWRKLGLDE